MNGDLMGDREVPGLSRVVCQASFVRRGSRYLFVALRYNHISAAGKECIERTFLTIGQLATSPALMLESDSSAGCTVEALTSQVIADVVCPSNDIVNVPLESMAVSSR